MGKKEKLFRRVQNNQKNIRFTDFCLLMTYFGFERTRVSGSHHLYQHTHIETVMNVQPRKDGLAKAYQVKQFLKLVRDNQLRLNNEDDE